MAGLNRATLIGNLGQDPEIRRTQSGDPVASLSIATNETWTDKSSGQKKEAVEWHRVVIFGKLAEVAEKYLKKGSKVFIEGKIKTRKWQDKSGADRWSTEIVLTGFGGNLIMLDGKGGDRPPAADSEEDYRQASGSSGGKPLALDEEMNDSIPF